MYRIEIHKTNSKTIDRCRTVDIIPKGEPAGYKSLIRRGYKLNFLVQNVEYNTTSPVFKVLTRKVEIFIL